METYSKPELEVVISCVQTGEIVIEKLICLSMTKVKKNGEGTGERLALCLKFIAYSTPHRP